MVAMETQLKAAADEERYEEAARLRDEVAGKFKIGILSGESPWDKEEVTGRCKGRQRRGHIRGDWIV